MKSWWALDLRALALLRISYGLIIFLDILVRAVDLRAHYSDAGVAPRDFIVQNYLDPWQFSIYLANGQSAFVGVLFMLFALAALALAVGYQTRLAALLCWVHLISLHNRNSLVLDGGDIYLRVVFFWALFLPWGARWSLDARKQAGPPRNQNRWFDAASFALLIQIGSIYFFAACLKTGLEWRSQGSAVYYALMIDQLTTPLAGWLLPHKGLLQFASYSVLIFESVVGFLLLGPPWLRGIGCLGLLAMHAGFGLCFHLGVFGLIGIASPLALWPGFVLDRLEGTRLVGWLARLPFPSLPAAGPAGVDFTRLPWQLLIALLAGLTLAWNVGNLPGRVLPSWYPRPLIMGLGLNQAWDMFSPKPLVEDGWFVIDAVQLSGTHIDLFRAGRALSWEKPSRVAAEYPNARWRKYMMNLWLSNHANTRLPYGKYLTTQWNGSHRGEEQVKSFQICFMLERTIADGAAPLEKVVIWNHLCFDEPPSKP